jgi:hypothetical protein
MAFHSTLRKRETKTVIAPKNIQSPAELRANKERRFELVEK